MCKGARQEAMRISPALGDPPDNGCMFILFSSILRKEEGRGTRNGYEASK